MQSTDLSQTLARSCASGSNAGMCGEEYRTLAKCKSRLKFCGFRGFSRCFFVCGGFFLLLWGFYNYNSKNTRLL